MLHSDYAASRGMTACCFCRALSWYLCAVNEEDPLTDYFLERLEFREIPRDIVEAMPNKAVERYFDVETGRFIALQ
jgi:hypothetical protein